MLRTFCSTGFTCDPENSFFLIDYFVSNVPSTQQRGASNMAKSPKETIFYVSLFSTIAFFVSMVLNGITMLTIEHRMNVNFDSHLRVASHASTVVMAVDELQLAMGYLEEHKLTEGNTGIFWKTNDKDLGIYHQKLMDEIQHLESLSEDPKEQDLALTRVSEVVYSYPSGISFYPYTKLSFISFILSIVLLLLSVVVAIITEP